MFKELVFGGLVGYIIGQRVHLLKYLYMPSSLKKYSKNKYTLSYVHNGKSYTIFIPIKRGPSMFMEILNENGCSVYDDVYRYLGPNEDFHGTSLCPQDMGYRKLIFITPDMQEFKFGAYDILSIPKN